MQKIDAHQHFWKFDPARDSWITNDMLVIRKNFLPQHLEVLLKENGFDGCVAVQADQSEIETDFLLELAENNDLIKGVVGWVDLKAENIEERLKFYQQFTKLKGFRHILQGEKDRASMLQPAFIKGIKALNQYNFTYDILIYPDQLAYAKKLVELFPDQRFVIDHIAKPPVKDKKIDTWRKGMEAIASHPNLSCKISGLATEDDWKNWKPENFTPYLDVVVNAFGPDRLMFGSDWPVCLLAASYKEAVDIVQEHFSSFTKYEQDKIFGGNAIKFYNLN